MLYLGGGGILRVWKPPFFMICVILTSTFFWLTADIPRCFYFLLTNMSAITNSEDRTIVITTFIRDDYSNRHVATPEDFYPAKIFLDISPIDLNFNHPPAFLKLERLADGQQNEDYLVYFKFFEFKNGYRGAFLHSFVQTNITEYSLVGALLKRADQLTFDEVPPTRTGSEEEPPSDSQLAASIAAAEQYIVDNNRISFLDSLLLKQGDSFNQNNNYIHFNIKRE